MAGVGIDFAGRSADGFGLALWQADGTGPEPAAAGHSFDTPIGRINSHYYIASRDYAGIDPTARGGLAAQTLTGCPRLTAALGAAGLVPADLVICLPLITPGADREGIDWSYRDGVETRFLRPASPIPLVIGDDVAVYLVVTRLVLTEDYRGANEFADARLSLVTDPFTVTLVASASKPVATIAQAFLQDLNGRKLRFTAERVILLPDGFTGNGRTHGYFADIPAARLSIV